MTPPSDLIAMARATAARFRERYVRALNLPATEEMARSTSWGVMQVMGQVAREHGFRGRFLSEICSPMVGIEIGCVVLAKKLLDASGDVAKGLLLWNGSNDALYPGRVLNKMLRYSQA